MPSPEPATRPEDVLPDEASSPGSFFRRVIAYLIDAVPMTALVVAIYAAIAPGFFETLAVHAASPDDIEARIAYLSHRNLVRDLVALTLVLYGTVLEASALEGTLGKRLLGLRVHDLIGERLSWKTAFVRNVGKLIGMLPCAIGVLWILFDKSGQSLHDKAAYTVVLRGAKPATRSSEGRPIAGAVTSVVLLILLGLFTGAILKRVAHLLASS